MVAGCGGAGEREATESAVCIEVSRYLCSALYTGNSVKAWYLFADPPPQHHAQVYEGEQEAIIDPALWAQAGAGVRDNTWAHGLAFVALKASRS